jgi:hypothetical protein
MPAQKMTVRSSSRLGTSSRNELRPADDSTSKALELVKNLIIPTKYDESHLKAQAAAVLALSKILEGGEFIRNIDKEEWGTKGSKSTVFLNLQVPIEYNTELRKIDEKFEPFWSNYNSLDLLTSVLCVNNQESQAISTVLKIISTLRVDSVRLWASLSFNKYKPLVSLVNFTCKSCPEAQVVPALSIINSVCPEPGATLRLAEIFGANSGRLGFLFKLATEAGPSQAISSQLLKSVHSIYTEAFTMLFKMVLNFCNPGTFPSMMQYRAKFSPFRAPSLP